MAQIGKAWGAALRGRQGRGARAPIQRRRRRYAKTPRELMREHWVKPRAYACKKKGHDWVRVAGGAKPDKCSRCRRRREAARDPE